MFWAEVVSTTTYLINRFPSTALEIKTPKEVWSGHPPNLDRLRVLGWYYMLTLGKIGPNL